MDLCTNCARLILEVQSDTADWQGLANASLWIRAHFTDRNSQQLRVYVTQVNFGAQLAKTDGQSWAWAGSVGEQIEKNVRAAAGIGHIGYGYIAAARSLGVKNHMMRGLGEQRVVPFRSTTMQSAWRNAKGIIQEMQRNKSPLHPPSLKAVRRLVRYENGLLMRDIAVAIGENYYPKLES